MQVSVYSEKMGMSVGHSWQSVEPASTKGVSLGQSVVFLCVVISNRFL